MSPQDLSYLCSVVRDRSGIVLTSDKRYLIENRLGSIVTGRGLNGISALVTAMRTHHDEALISQVVEAMTVNESLFFRDGKPFDVLCDAVLPTLFAARIKAKPIRIWSAACSSGQEPYSIAIAIKESMASFGDRSFEIIATDIARTVLAKARTGTYTQFEVQRGMPIRLLIKYFNQTGKQWQIKPEIRNMVRIQEQNILKDFASLGIFDVIFCRNVLIYFDSAVKRSVLERMAKSLAADGTLFLGSAETVNAICNCLAPLPGYRGAYQRTDVTTTRMGSVAGSTLATQYS